MRFFLILVIVMVISLSGVQGSSSSGAGVAPQTCGTDNRNFYCRYANPTCQPRSQRCTGGTVCLNPSTRMEEGCDANSDGSYKVFLGVTSLSSLISSKRSTNLRLQHEFIRFRGFTYEFGSSYGIQILDVTDPKYKYNTEPVRSITHEGSSHCTWEEVNYHISTVNMMYALTSNNCQDFAEGLKEFLLNAPCAQAQGKQSVTLEEYVNKMVQNCSLTCGCSNGTDKDLPKLMLVIIACMIWTIVMYV